MYRFSRQFMTFPELLIFGHPKKTTSPISTRICVPNLVAVRRSCRRGGGGTDRQTDRQTDIQTDRQTDKGKLQLYIVDEKVHHLIIVSNNLQITDVKLNGL